MPSDDIIPATTSPDNIKSPSPDFCLTYIPCQHRTSPPPPPPPPKMAPTDTAKRIEEAQKQATSNPSSAEATYKDILSKGPGSTDASSRDYEAALMALGELYRDQKKPNELADLVRATREELSNLPKAKTAKIGQSCTRLPARRTDQN